MKKLNFREIAIPTVALFLICLIVTALLAGTNLLTKDAIAAQDLKKAESTRRIVLSDAQTFTEATAGDVTYYVGTDASGSDVGYVFTTAAKGYGGEIQVMTGIGADGEVKGVAILSHEETPGLGANTTREDFRAQFQQPVPEEGFSLVKSAPGDGEIQALTGATISSTAVTNAVNEAIAAYQTVQGGSN